ncbi:forkhead box protein R1 isoform X2 [Scleropages formosus]|nr:forkhead box protein R1 isoform X2 [Scleropages formosus]
MSRRYPSQAGTTMFLHIENRSSFLALHLKTCLDDWDMSEEVKLTTTTDQFYQDGKRSEQQGAARCNGAELSRREEEERDARGEPRECPESQVEPSLWLMVNPTVACPIEYPEQAAWARPSTGPTRKGPPGVSSAAFSPSLIPHVHPPSPVEETSRDASLHEASSSSEYLGTDEDNASPLDVRVCCKVKWSRRVKLPKEKIRKLGMAQSKRLQRVLQESNYLKNGEWPRPPVNYCILIAMALNSSHCGSLNVQQIYNFTREHFPFFQTAPDGWKNTIRHNLCFSNSFKKTPQQVSSEGKRKSCLWHLTLDGRRRLSDEIHTLSGESFRVLRRSMNNPGKCVRHQAREQLLLLLRYCPMCRNLTA